MAHKKGKGRPAYTEADKRMLAKQRKAANKTDREMRAAGFAVKKVHGIYRYVKRSKEERQRSETAKRSAKVRAAVGKASDASARARRGRGRSKAPASHILAI